MLIFLKLGGSLITDKNKPLTAYFHVIDRIASEISSALKSQKELKLIIGHGSGSFGHSVAKEYGTHEGSNSQEDWLGFQKVWYAARELNQIVLNRFVKNDIPVVSFPPSAYITSSNKNLESWNYFPIQSALENNLIPLIYGDVIFDRLIGSTIFSTEDLFVQLAELLNPNLILIAGKEPGVWNDYPDNKELIANLNPENWLSCIDHIYSSSSPDVTGGMVSKIKLMIDLVKRLPQTKVRIFSGKEPGDIFEALLGKELGTLITSSK